MSRWLDPDDDYQYDRTNRPPSRQKSAWVLEMEARAAKCLSFLSSGDLHVALKGVCKNCGGAAYAHGEHALRQKAS